MRRSQAGLTLVELLVAATLLVILLGLVALYFGQQANLSRDTQARSQVQDAARAAMQLVTNDLLSAGSNQYVISGAPVTKVALAGAVPTGTDGGLDDTVTMEYVSSLRGSLGTACRHVVYQVNAGSLERSDVACGGTDSFSNLADHVLAFDLVYVCSDASTADEPSECPANTYVRSVRVAVMLRSDNPAKGGQSAATYATTTVDHPSAVAGGSVSCPSGYVCALLRQEVQTPSLKQYAPGG